jgi:pimeloyl-ACP methyl ester carboxylesterase
MPVREKPIKHSEAPHRPTPGNPSPAPGLHPIAMPWSDVDVSTSHGRIAVRTGRGTGTPILLLHGNSSSKEAFAGLMSSGLRHACRMIALDLPGHGTSQDARVPGRTYTVPGYADAVIEVLDLSHVAIFGWSLGGHIAIEIASRYPGVLGLMLCGTPPVGLGLESIVASFTPSRDLGLAGQNALSPADVRAFAKLTVGDATHAGALAAIARTDGRARELMYAHLLAGGVPDQRAFVESTTVPVAVVNGADDPVVNVDYLSSVRYASLWYRRVHLIAKGGHAPFLTQPKAFEAVFGRFIRSMNRRHDHALRNPDLCLSG